MNLTAVVGSPQKGRTTDTLVDKASKDPGQPTARREYPALVIPGGDLVYRNLNGERGDGVLHHSITPSQSCQAAPFVSDPRIAGSSTVPEDQDAVGPGRKGCL